MWIHAVYTLCAWRARVCAHAHLASFDKHNVFEIHPCFCIISQFLLLFNSILLYEYMAVCFSILLLIDIWVVSNYLVLILQILDLMFRIN